MKIEQIMTPAPATCDPADNLAQVVERMWDADCGIVPVVDDAGHLLGVITDRDICIAAGTRDLAPAEIHSGGRAVDAEGDSRSHGSRNATRRMTLAVG